MPTKIQLRRGTAALWTSTNPILAEGEQGLETDTGKIKIGNGVGLWSALPYAIPVGGTDTQVQFNDGGAFGGDAGFTYNKTTKAISLAVNGKIGWFNSAVIFNGNGAVEINAANNPVLLRNNFGIGGSLTFGIQYGFHAGVDVEAAHTLAQRNGANAQTSRIYGTFTDAGNHRRLSLGMSTAGVARIAPEGAGTGASGNVLHISGLPTANPGPGILWNDAGTVKVGT